MDNILIRLNPQGDVVECKVSDFGIARRIDYTEVTSFAGKLYWRAPEQTTTTKEPVPLTREIDIYCFGLVRS
jgi:serine/threonine protein kinase